MSNPQNIVYIYTDGACKGNPGPGGWGAALKYGDSVKEIKGFQRYPVSNHFNWLLNGEPSGHDSFSHLNNPEFHKQYEKLLVNVGQTDTIIGYFGA